MNRSDPNQFSLLDHHGPWCAWCLGPILPNEPVERHHVLPTEAVKKFMHLQVRLPWIVPAHFGCHRNELQIKSDMLSGYLQRILALPASALSQLNERLHNASFYWFPVLTYAYKFNRSPHEAGESIAYLFSSASGVRGGRHILTRLMQALPVPPGARELINFSNLEFSSGSYRRAQDYLKLAGSKITPLKGAERDATRAAFLRRKAQMELDLAAASEAQALSESNAYNVRTTILHKGLITLVRDHSTKAIEYFESLAESTNPTWLYRAEVLFALSLCSIAQDKIDEETYACLVTAQYLYAMLGLVGPSWRFLWYDRNRNAFPNTPTKVLLNHIAFRRFKREQCFDIRQMAIFGSARSSLLKTVLGEQNLRDALFDGLFHAFPR